MPNTQIPLALIATRILNVPLLITKDKIEQILHVIGERIGLDIEPKTQIQYSPPKPKSYKVDDGIAIIPINGSLVHKTSGFLGASGLVSYSSIRASFDDALEDPDAHSILFDINSSGGEVAGVFDLVDHIYYSRGRKPIYAMSNESAYSAAYAIASAADKIYLSRTAGVGSIGVIMIHVDRSEAAAKAGLKYTHIYAGSHKTDGSPYKPLSSDAKSKAQSIVNSLYDLFVYTVARNNGLNEEDVFSTQADTYHGSDAIEAGLADSVLSYQEVIKTIKSQNRKPTYGGINLMPNRNANPETKLETPEGKLETQNDPIITTSSDGIVITNLHQQELPLTQTNIDEAVQSERTRCITILESCSLAKTPELANDLISDGSSIDTAHKMIMMVLAERSDVTTVVSTLKTPPTSNHRSAIIADAKRRAERTRAARRGR